MLVKQGLNKIYR